MPDGEELNPGATEGNPPENGTPKDSRWQPRKIKVKGQEFVVDSESKAIELMQKGAHYDQGQAALKERERELREKHAKTMEQLDPLIEIDRRLREDPRKAAIVNAVLNDKPIEPFLDSEEATDDVYLQRIGRVERMVEQLGNRFSRDVGAVRGEVGQVRRTRQLDDAERHIRKKYPWATEEDVEEARSYAEEHNLDLVTAFKVASFDELPERTRRETIQEFGFEEGANMGPARSEEFVLEGFGPINDPKQLNRLYDDPELYARFRPALRARKRALSGKRELPR